MLAGILSVEATIVSHWSALELLGLLRSLALCLSKDSHQFWPYAAVLAYGSDIVIDEGGIYLCELQDLYSCVYLFPEFIVWCWEIYLGRYNIPCNDREVLCKLWFAYQKLQREHTLLLLLSLFLQ